MNTTEFLLGSTLGTQVLQDSTGIGLTALLVTTIHSIQVGTADFTILGSMVTMEAILGGTLGTIHGMTATSVGEAIMAGAGEDTTDIAHTMRTTTFQTTATLVITDQEEVTLVEIQA